MPKHLRKHRYLLFGLLALALLTLGVLPAWAAPNTTTKILFVQGNTSADLTVYKNFLSTSVYPGQTMVFSGDTLADKYYFTTAGQDGILSPAQLARLNDADLVIVTPDISVTDLVIPDWNPTYAPNDWNNINVPMIVHHPYLVNSPNGSGTGYLGQWGWTENAQNNDTMSWGPFFGVPNGTAAISWNSYNRSWQPTIGTDPFYTGVTQYTGTNTSVWVSLVQNGNIYKIASSNTNHTPGGGTELAEAYMTTTGSGNSWQYAGDPFIIRYPQGAKFNAPYRKAGAKRFLFSLGAKNDTNAVNSFLGDAVNGATADGKTLLKNALTYLYSPANGRRPIPFAGAANTRLNIVGSPVNFTVADATYSDGEGGAVFNTMQWTIQALDSRNEGSETIVSGGTSLTPQFRFTKQGTYVASLTVNKLNLDSVVSQRTFTVGGASVPYIASVSPQQGRLLATSPLGTVTVAFDHAITFTAPLQLTVTGGTPTPSTVPGTTADNINFSFDCSGIALSGINTQIGLSLDTSTVKDAIGGTLAFPTATYVWGYVFNSTAPQRQIVLCSNRGTVSNNAYVTLLQSVYGASTPITVWNQVNYNAATWSASTSATLQNAALVIVDSNEGLNYAQWNALRAPLLTNSRGFCTGNALNMAPNGNNWGSQERGTLCQNYIDNPFFEGVALRADGLIHLMTADRGLDFLTYNTGSGNPTNTFTSTPNGLPFMIYGTSGEASFRGMYWPANTVYHTGTANKAAGRRLFALSDTNSNSNLWATNAIITPEGVKFAQNLHKYFAQPTGAPTVVWKDMDTQVWHKLTSVLIRFDRATTTPGALTIKKADNTTVIYTTAAAPTTSDTLTYRYVIPAATWVGIGSQTLNFSIPMTGVRETESGYNLPFLGGSTYAWQSYYDTTKLRQHIGVLDRDRQDDDLAAFTNLVQSYYGPSTWVEFLENSGDTFAAGVAPWSQTFMNRLNACDMLIVGGNQNTYLGPTYWTLNGGVAAWPKPIISGYGATYSSPQTNWASTTAGGWGADDNITQITAIAPTSPLFAGVNFTLGKSTVWNSYRGDYWSVGGIGKLAASGSGVTLNGAIGATVTSVSDVFAAYVPAGSALYNTSTVTHAAARAFNSLFDVESVQLLSGDGKTIVRNQLGMMIAPPQAPIVQSTTPGATVNSPIGTTVSITFDRPVMAPGAMTMSFGSGTHAPIVVPTATTTDNMTFTYTLPANAMVGQAIQTLTFSVVTAGVYETVSGFQLPYPTNPYVWTSAYNPGLLGIKILGITEGAVGASGQDAFVAYVKSIWGPNTTVDWMYDTWHDANGLANIEANMVVVRAAIAAHDLVVIDSVCGQYKFDTGHGWLANAGLTPPTTGVTATITKPMICFSPSCGDSSHLQVNDGSASRASQSYFVAVNTASPIFNGVTLPGNNHVTVFSTPLTLPTAHYTNLGAGFVARSQYGDVTPDLGDGGIAYFPANSQDCVGGLVHPGRTATFALGSFNNIASLTTDGNTLLTNTLKTLRPLDAGPLVLSTTPGATAGSAIATVSVVFDRPATSPGTLTMTGSISGAIATVTTPASPDGGVTWTYTLPAGSMLGKPSQTFQFSADMTGVYETATGLQLPYQGANPYTWSTAYDVSKLTTIVFCTSKATGMGTGGIYDTFLKSVYPGATVNFMPVAQYGVTWTPATLAAMQAATLVIVDSANTSEFTSPQWNTLTTPILIFSHRFLWSTGPAMAPATGADYQASNGYFNVVDPDPLLFNGVTIGLDGSVLQDTVSTNMDLMDYLGAGTIQNGITFGTHDNSNFYRSVMQYWPANTTFYAGGTTSAAGRRMYYAIDTGYGGNSTLATSQLSANGQQMVKNVLKWMMAGSTTGQPVVASTIPAATAFQRLNTVTVQFDRHVTQPGALTVTGSVDGAIATVATPTAGPEGGIRWIYTLPAGAMNGKVAQTLTFSVVMTGITETESGLQLPYAGAAPYTWTSVYNPANTTNIVFLTNKTTGQNVYTTFLQSVYGPNTTVNFLPDSAWFNYAQPFQPYTRSLLQSATLILYDGSTGVTAGSNIDHPQWNALATPMIAMTTPGPTTANWGWATSTNGWQKQGVTTVNQDPLIFQNVYINPTNNFVTTNIETAANAPLLQSLEYNPQSAPTYRGVNFGYYRPGNEQDVLVQYWPANTVYFNGGSKSSVGNRMWFSAVGGGNNGDSEFALGKASADGVQLFANVLKWMSWPAGQPQVSLVTPANGLVVTKAAPSSVSVVFDRPVAGVTNITVNGAVVGSPVASVDNTVYTWAIPAIAQPNVTCTVNFAMTENGIYETGSGLQLPMGSGTYNWSVTYDKTQFHPTIGLISNTDTSDDHSAYASFLLNDVYATTLYTRVAQIEDIRGKYYNAIGLPATTRAAMEGSLSLVIVLPFQTSAQIATKTQWNLLGVPVMQHKPDAAASWGWGGSTGNVGNWRSSPNDNWMEGHFGLSDPISVGIMAENGLSDYNGIPDPIWAGTNFWNSVLGNGIGAIYWWAQFSPALRGLVVNNGIYSLPTATQPQLYTPQGWGNAGNSVQAMAKWETGNNYNGGGTTPARRFFFTMGAQVSNDNYGSTEVATFFNPATGAVDKGAKQALRNSLRWLMNPDSLPVTFPLAVKTASPPAGGQSGVYQSPIQVIFTKPVSGVQPADLTWQATTSNLTYVSTAATPAGSVPTDTWIFDGGWETNTTLIGVFQPITITLNPMDTPTHSHITSADGDGCPLSTWTWQYTWVPVPAAVSQQLWTLYQ